MKYDGSSSRKSSLRRGRGARAVLEIIGTVEKVIGPVIHARGVTTAKMLDLVEVGEDHLVGEIVKLDGEHAAIQVYEDTTGLAPGAAIYSAGVPLSVELGPGLLGTIYDGIQRPLEVIRDASDQYIQRGIHVPALDREARWAFEPVVAAGTAVTGGETVGEVQETGLIKHRVLVPPGVKGTVSWTAGAGEYGVDDVVCRVETEAGSTREVKLHQRWPVRRGRPVGGRLPLHLPLVTGQRVVDTLFPVAKGGTVVVPGGFGTGKTMIQHALSKWSDADIIVYIGCGERGNEMTDVLISFPELVDPRSGRPIMERTVLIANTSNMPVAAREASIYTGITIAEYYRDQGYHVAIMADSTSRWAEALRELSGRMEEMPADEGYPAYLPTRLAEFYERAGMVETIGGGEGSISIVGSVSPPGGDFSEPVTQHTKRFVRCLWALDRQLANARHYPAISWLDSYSEYVEEIADWWQQRSGGEWMELRQGIMTLLQQEGKLQQVVKLVGPDVLPDTQRIVLETCTMFKNAFLQQNSFDKVDMYCTPEKQVKMLRIIIDYYELGLENIKKGANIHQIKKMEISSEIMRMKFAVPNDEIGKLDEIRDRLRRSMQAISDMFD
ncbi:MAG: V-type ATP synthase subunit A [Candidatus Krumholzibacteriota bacterium]|nr:V-type ATP synthase subunit A [Candidatus Krumholzibacteriota bacterium]